MAKGFLIIADISGYTSFLTHAELEPAAELLRPLLEILIEETRPPLVVSKMEGDAVLSYALEGTFLRGQTLVEMIEATYVAFREALDQLVLNSQCDCHACLTVPELDLKFFVHHGTFLLQSLAGRTAELVGNDVILIHRLTKNNIVARTGLSAYVAYTAQAVQQLQIQELAAGMTPVIEDYEHIGQTLLYVEDMHPLWEKRQQEKKWQVTQAQALVWEKKLFPASQVLIWDYITLPEYRFLTTGSNALRLSAKIPGRIGPGSTYQCIDDQQLSRHTIRDWDPPHLYSFESDRPFRTRGLTTVQLAAVGDQTEVTVLVGKSQSQSQIAPIARAADLACRQSTLRNIKTALTNLSESLAARTKNNSFIPLVSLSEISF